MLNKVIKKDIEISKIYDRKSMIKDYAIKLSNKKINKLYDKAKSSKNKDISSFVFDSYSKNASENLKYIYDIICKF